MTDNRQDWPVLAGVVAMASLAVAAGVVASQALARSFSLALYVAVTLAATLDLIDLCFRLYLCRANGSRADLDGQAATSVPIEPTQLDVGQKRAHLRPYAIIASIYNAEDSLDDFMRAMGPYREHVWLVDDCSTDLTPARLRQAGWRCERAAANAKKPGAIRSLLARLPREIETVVVIDPDIVFHDSKSGAMELEAVLFDFQRSGMSAACPRIAIREEGLLTRFQALEYCMSFSLGRRSLGEHCVNSGISIYRRADLEAVLDKHTLSVYAEDLENAILLMDTGRPVYYDGRLVVETEAKRSLGAWFSQRVGWHYGLLRVYAHHMDAVRRAMHRGVGPAYQFGVYTGLFCVALQPLKVFGLALAVLGLAKGFDGLLGLDLIPDTPLAEPAYVLSAWGKYTVLALLALFIAVPRRERAACAPVVPLYFFYASAHIVPATVGYLNWMALRWGRRRLFADHYQEEATINRAKEA